MDGGQTLIIDDREVSFYDEGTLIDVFEHNQINVPHLCFHSGLTPSGHCGLCTIEIWDENSEEHWIPALACVIKPEAGMRIRTTSERIALIREMAGKLLLRSHPCDCNFCEQFGTCELRNIYNRTRFGFTRAIEDGKHKKPILSKLSERFLLDREKCIQCGLCVTFFREELGEDFLHIVSPDGERFQLDPYSQIEIEDGYWLNAIEVCPCNAIFDAAALSALPSWQLKKVPSIAPDSSTGSNIDLFIEGDEVVYVKPRPNPDVNLLISDKVRNWFAKNNDNRIDDIILHGQKTDIREGMLYLLSHIGFGYRCAIVGHASQSLESLFLIRQLADVLGASVFFKKHPQAGDGWLISEDADTNLRGALLTKALKNTAIDDFSEIEKLIDDKQIKTLIVVSEDLVAEGFPVEKLKNVCCIIFSSSRNQTTPHGELIFPITTIAEEDGHLINRQFRLQRYHKALQRKTSARALWEWLALIKNGYMGRSAEEMEYQTIEEVWTALEKLIPELAKISLAKLPDNGVVLDDQRFVNYPFLEHPKAEL